MRPVDADEACGVANVCCPSLACDCEARYGSYVDYAQEDVNALQRAEEELEGFVASAEEVVAPVM